MDNKDRQEVLKRINEVSDCFYQNKINTGISGMSELIKSLKEIIDRLPEEEQVVCYQHIKNLIEAYKTEDYIMTADILVYDILEMI